MGTALPWNRNQYMDWFSPELTGMFGWGIRRSQMLNALRGTTRTEDFEREKDQRSEEQKDTVNCDADDPKRQQQKPNNRIGDERNERQRPTEKQQDEPEQKFCHETVPLLSLAYGISMGRVADPMRASLLTCMDPLHCCADGLPSDSPAFFPLLHSTLSTDT
jgi:hypothetical protein